MISSVPGPPVLRIWPWNPTCRACFRITPESAGVEPSRSMMSGFVATTLVSKGTKSCVPRS